MMMIRQRPRRTKPSIKCSFVKTVSPIRSRLRLGFGLIYCIDRQNAGRARPDIRLRVPKTHYNNFNFLPFMLIWRLLPARGFEFSARRMQQCPQSVDISGSTEPQTPNHKVGTRRGESGAARGRGKKSSIFGVMPHSEMSGMCYATNGSRAERGKTHKEHRMRDVS